VVEDDDGIADPLVEGLEREGFEVDRVADGAAALAAAPADLVLLDLRLPDMDGYDVCRQLRSRSPVPILIVSARGTEVDRVVGLELGADDYLVKPFGFRELVARIRAVTRRAQVPVPSPALEGAAHAPQTASLMPGAGPGTAGSPAAGEPTPAEPQTGHAEAFDDAAGMTGGAPRVRPSGGVPPGAGQAAQDLGGLVVDRRTRRVYVEGAEVELSPKEFDLLALLAEDPGAVVTRESLLEQVWGPHWYGPTKTVDVHVATLRRKLGHPEWVETVRRVGLRLGDTAGTEGRSGAAGPGQTA
jgi:DNA-binding response OmpR family regulator